MAGGKTATQDPRESANLLPGRNAERKGDQYSSGLAWQVERVPLGVQLKPTAQKGKVSSPSSFGAPQTAPCPPEQDSSELLPLTGTAQM